MNVEKNNDKNEKKFAGRCCDGMTEMMGKCCPSGPTSSDCFAWMKEFGKYWSPEKSEPADRKHKVHSPDDQ